MNPRGDLRASSSKQSPEAARVRNFTPRRMAVCRVCVGVLDVVVTEWHLEEQPIDQGDVCVACGAPAEVWVSSPTPPPPQAVIAVDLTGPVIRIDVTGTLDGATAETVAVELDRLGSGHEPIVLNLSEVSDTDEDGRLAIIAAIAATEVVRRMGLVTPTGWRGRSFRVTGRAKGNADVVVGDDVNTVISRLTSTPT